MRLGIVLGSVLPDADILAMAVATIAGLPTERLRRTFTHSLFTVAMVLLVLRVVAWAIGRPQWKNLGLGLGIGILMHIALDLAIWFRGVEILWPLRYEVDFWQKVAVPGWWRIIELPAEFLSFALLFLVLYRLAARQDTDLSFLRRLRLWVWVQCVLFVTLTVLAYALGQQYRVVHGVLYLPSLGLVIGVVIRMRSTLEGKTHRA